MLRPSMSRGRPAFGCADSRARVIVDIRSIVSSMGAGPKSKLHAGLTAAALVGATALGRGDVVRLGLLPERVTKAFSGPGATSSLLDALQDVRGAARVALSDAIRAAFPRVRRRGFALLVTDFLDEPAAWRRAVECRASSTPATCRTIHSVIASGSRRC